LRDTEAEGLSVVVDAAFRLLDNEGTIPVLLNCRHVHTTDLINEEYKYTRKTHQGGMQNTTVEQQNDTCTRPVVGNVNQAENR